MAYFETNDFVAKIEQMRWYFGGLELPRKLEFIQKLRSTLPEDAGGFPQYRKFVNECIQDYNEKVRRHNSDVRIQELRGYYNELNHPTKLAFIEKLQEHPPEIRNHSKYRKLANDCIEEYNTEARRRNNQTLEDIFGKEIAKAISKTSPSHYVQPHVTQNAQPIAAIQSASNYYAKNVNKSTVLPSRPNSPNPTTNPQPAASDYYKRSKQEANRVAAETAAQYEQTVERAVATYYAQARQR